MALSRVQSGYFLANWVIMYFNENVAKLNSFFLPKIFIFFPIAQKFNGSSGKLERLFFLSSQ
jgi:hypothetical protein